MLRFQELIREGWSQAYRRWSVQRQILNTPPFYTAAHGSKEVRVLAWRRDWINVIWALKSFYHYSNVDYPLYIHDGGLENWQARRLCSQFPNAVFIQRSDADAAVEQLLQERGLDKCIQYRRKNVSTKKVFDFFLLSHAECVISIDPDVIFFRTPHELLKPVEQIMKNRYNKDCQYAYSMSLDDLEEAFSIRPPAFINSGLSLIARKSMNFEQIECWLHNWKLFSNPWISEQTLHALSATLHGVELLPPAYLVGIEPGLSPEVISKHYPEFFPFRPLLYQEGMRHLVQNGALSRLRKAREQR